MASLSRDAPSLLLRSPELVLPVCVSRCSLHTHRWHALVLARRTLFAAVALVRNDRDRMMTYTLVAAFFVSRSLLASRFAAESMRMKLPASPELACLRRGFSAHCLLCAFTLAPGCGLRSGSCLLPTVLLSLFPSTGGGALAVASLR